ncbi:hypothetical protein ACHAWF_011205 [Thalassiosira exigua]
MDDFRKMAYEITGDPSTYPLKKEVEYFGHGTEVLTKNIGMRLNQKQLSTTRPEEDKIYLQVTHAESTMSSSSIDDVTVSVQKWKFTAIDGDETSIMLRIDSTLNAGNLLTPGAVVEVHSFAPVYFRYDDEGERRCAIVVRKFEVVGRQVLSQTQLGPPKKRAKLTKPTKKHEPNQVSIGDGGFCSGELCSKYGVEFVTCLTECIPVQEVSLSLVARECFFATRSLEMMTPRDKRFLFYYYYATTVYQFHGRGNRVELPECLKMAVRQLYPDVEQLE